MINRPLESVAMQIQEPSPNCAECSNSTLNPGNTVSDSAAVAGGVLSTSPHGWSPSFPWIAALLHDLSSTVSTRQLSWVSFELSQLLSVVINSLCFLLSLSSSETRTPACSPFVFLARIARMLFPFLIALLTSSKAGLL